MNFIFENKQEVRFLGLDDSPKMHIINNIQGGNVESLWHDGWFRVDDSEKGGPTSRVEFEGVYRVLAKPYLIEDAYRELSDICITGDDTERSGTYVKYDDVRAILRNLSDSAGDKS